MNNESNSTQDAKFDIQLRPIGDDDLVFLKTLYASTRANELAMVPWTDREKDDFIDMQFKAQHIFYQEQFKEAEFSIVVRNGIDIGRLYLDLRDDEIRIIDIAILPNFQKLGVGKKLLIGVSEQATERGVPITIHVEKNNPAMTLYEKLGYKFLEDQGVYHLMRWSSSG